MASSPSGSRHQLLLVAGILLGALSATEALAAVRVKASASATPDPTLVSVLANTVETVRVTTRTCSGTDSGAGLVLGDGRVLTAAHVVADAVEIVIDGLDHAPAAATLLGVDADGRDLAVLAVPALAGRTRPVLFDGVVPRNEPIAAAGYPAGVVRQTMWGTTSGYVDAGPLAADGGRVLLSSIAFVGGMSGGPVVDGSGRVVGMVIGVEKHSGTGIAVPADALASLLAGDLAAPRVPCRHGG